MKTIEDELCQEVKINLNHEWLSYQLMMAQISDPHKEKNLTSGINNIVKYVNDNHDDICDTGYINNKKDLIKSVYIHANDDLESVFVENLEEKGRGEIKFDLDSEWFNYSLMMKHVYSDSKKYKETDHDKLLSIHANDIMDSLNEEYTGTKLYYPEMTHDELVNETYEIVETDIFRSFLSSPTYKKYEDSLKDFDIN